MGMVYVVTAGVYSDYGILGIYDDSELADKAVELYNSSEKWSKAEIEVRELNPNADAIKKGYTHYFVTMTKEGVAQIGSYGDCFDDAETICFGFGGAMYISGLFKNEEHAIKSTNEKRLVLIAENRWGKK